MRDAGLLKKQNLQCFCQGTFSIGEAHDKPSMSGICTVRPFHIHSSQFSNVPAPRLPKFIVQLLLSDHWRAMYKLHGDGEIFSP